MRVITRRRVKVRVTVKRSDGRDGERGEGESHTWDFQRKQETGEKENEGGLRHRSMDNEFGKTDNNANLNDASSDNTYRSFDDMFDFRDDVIDVTVDGDSLMPSDIRRNVSMKTDNNNTETNSTRNNSKGTFQNSFLQPIEKKNYDGARLSPQPERQYIPIFKKNDIYKRSRSLPRDKDLFAPDKYSDSDLSTSFESGIDNIERQRTIPRFLSSRKSSFVRSLESINEDPMENGYSKRNNSGISHSLSERFLNYDVEESHRDYQKEGATPRRKLFTKQVLHDSNQLSLKSKHLHGDSEASKPAPRKRTKFFTNEGGDQDNDQGNFNRFASRKFDKPSNYISTSLVNLSDYRDNEDFGRFSTSGFKSNRGFKKGARSKSQSCLKSGDDLDSVRIVRNCGFTLAGKDLDGVFKENRFVFKTDDSDGDQTKPNTFSEIITFNKGNPENVETRSIYEDKDIQADPNWINERVLHRTEDGKLTTENVSRHLQTGTMIQTKTTINFSDDENQSTDSKSNLKESHSEPGNRLVRARSETIITMKKGW